MPQFSKMTLGAIATAAILISHGTGAIGAETGKGLFGFKSAKDSASELSDERSKKVSQSSQSATETKKKKKKKKQRRTNTRRGSFDY